MNPQLYYLKDDGSIEPVDFWDRVTKFSYEDMKRIEIALGTYSRINPKPVLPYQPKIKYHL